ncbi:MAG: nucleotide exchange factor GrpE [Casimicrobiaceae bacterium]
MNDQKPYDSAAGMPDPANPATRDESSNPEEMVDATALFDDAVTQLKKAEDEAAAMRDAYLRARADVENIRRQGQTEVAKAHRYGIEKFAESLLPVRDALETALAVDASPEAMRAGVELTLKQLAAAFDKAQLSVIDPARGEKFDPHAHQAMAMIDSDQPPNTVVQVMQRGYRLSDRVLRPAMVAVAKGNGNGA